MFQVYIYSGKLHLIPQPKASHSDRFPAGVPATKTAVTCIRQHSTQTQASERVQKDIRTRLAESVSLLYITV